MLRCCVFKNAKNLSASDSQLKRHIMPSIYRLCKAIFTFLKFIQSKGFITAHKRLARRGPREEPLATPSIWSQSVPRKKKYVPDGSNSKGLLKSALVMFKPGLCSNNKLTATSVVSLSGIQVNKLETS